VSVGIELNRVVNFPEILVLGGNFQKFSLIVNITNNCGTRVDLSETMHGIPMSTINHENNVLTLLLVHRGAVKADIK